MVRDNGRGLPPGAFEGSRQGLELVRGLAAHLGGHVAIEDTGGVAVRVIIPDDRGPRLN